MSEFTHINEQGNAKMVDVSEKNITKRTAIAHSSITVNQAIYQQIVDNTNKKGNVLNTAQIAGIMAAKNTADIIPMCHPLPLTGIDVSFNWKENETSFTLNIQASVSTTGKTGVEMEALTAASAVALTVYDMTKALDKSMIIGETYLLSKTGGKSGDFQRPN
ncbi:cyclic pyranopterin monophosphate synthase MoaC [Staphylococcus pseudoxylosus]|uniref:cyclic pyranopterin monophosphate synthase MoaC n=1 Tax=Staphylococcus pseudoxylosus TaxID=2282419 RepID=UPI000D1D1FFC|nr:cyclic pyranopterin monophosphate synthase MoaC [Staphylococcus pseudoxylosus]PTI45104.1 cyclic pyranopterin monophosphate synthase MoaC [Staphylococcus xylosus]MEB6037671.1 cyclic pyranopterin monophosphate synthase MoaC [Staphylococcus pseudoxylosus]MEB6171606.1 cyclic pyranopterin monophosphate synthase MoaC [Staphylococcus pseudoxylosus]MEB7754143.1 cyclic pyranopterin monophosphate synthase MoaC [Staphylococcus pseudoxylosus]MEB7764910.1 cyclic pyranopterin monophosphate synthase MoaC 